jgi:protein SCO1/2
VVSTEVTEQPSIPPPLSEEERAAAFRRTEPKVPRNVPLIALAVFAVLGIGGALGEHLLSNAGLNPGATTATTTSPTAANGGPVLAPPGTASSTQQVGEPLAAFMGIEDSARNAPPISLVDQSGATVTLAGERGDAVVVTFFNSTCQDICPVLSAELRQADSDLGPEADHVVFLTVNTDPKALSAAPAAAGTGLAALGNWHFLTSSLGNLNRVWKAYGVSITVSRSSGLVAHNEVMCFISPSGQIRYQATPFANESVSGVFTLPPADISRWAEGIATYARRLLGASS